MSFESYLLIALASATVLPILVIAAGIAFNLFLENAQTDKANAPKSTAANRPRPIARRASNPKRRAA